MNSGGSKGVLWTHGPLSVQLLSFSCSFQQTFCQIIDWRSSILVLAPLGNPVSATDKGQKVFSFTSKQGKYVKTIGGQHSYQCVYACSQQSSGGSRFAVGEGANY